MVQEGSFDAVVYIQYYLFYWSILHKEQGIYSYIRIYMLKSTSTLFLYKDQIIMRKAGIS